MKLQGFKKLEGIICCISGLHIGGTKDTIEIGGMDQLSRLVAEGVLDCRVCMYQAADGNAG